MSGPHYDSQKEGISAFAKICMIKGWICCGIHYPLTVYRCTKCGRMKP